MIRYYLILVLVSVFFISCSDSNNELDRKAIEALLNQNAKFYKMKNIDGMMDTYLKDSTIIALGTNKDYIGRGWDSVKVRFERDFAPNWEMISYEYENPVIRIHEDVAWLFAEVKSEVRVSMQGNFTIKLDTRLTAVCKKVDGKWKFVFTNFQHFNNPDQEIQSQIYRLMGTE